MKFIQKYTGGLRRYKLLYALYNFINQSKLKHNIKLYRKYGLNKSIFSTISSKDFEGKTGVPPWLDEPDAKKKLSEANLLRTFDRSIQDQILKWPDNGFAILSNFFNSEAVDQINSEIDLLLSTKKVDFNYTNKKIMFAFRQSETIRKIVYSPDLLKILTFIIGKEVIPFQTINFIKGSEQKVHSDSVHMTTFPLGYLIAVWIALEDTNLENGPVFYYPGSHKLPYLLNDGFDNGGSSYQLGPTPYRNYEKKMGEIIEKSPFEKKTFFAKKGDVLIWHANLAHGGLPVINRELTRKSMVIHYYCKDVICYHEITQRPAMFDDYPKTQISIFDND